MEAPSAGHGETDRLAAIEAEVISIRGKLPVDTGYVWLGRDAQAGLLSSLTL